MSKPYRDFEPNWFRGDFSKTSYRSIFKWGEPAQIKAPKETLYKMLKETFGLNDSDFDHYTEDLGLDEVHYDIPCNLDGAVLDALRAIAGAEYVRTDDYARLSVAYGKTMYDILRLRNKIVENIPDAVVYPDTKDVYKRQRPHQGRRHRQHGGRQPADRPRRGGGAGQGGFFHPCLLYTSRCV